MNEINNNTSILNLTRSFHSTTEHYLFYKPLAKNCSNSLVEFKLRSCSQNLNLIEQCDKFPYRHKEPELYESKVALYYKFKLENCNTILGWILPSVVSKLSWPDYWIIDQYQKILLLTGSSIEIRNARMAETLLAAKAANSFEILQKWRNKFLLVYGPGHELLINIERAGTALFGVMVSGVSLNAYVKEADGSMKYWAAQRAANKQTYPGMLDNTIGGGIATGDLPFESIVREAVEEADLPVEFVTENAQAVGIVTYFDIRDERAGGEIGLLSPECIYVYDLLVPESIVPRPGDMEAENFRLMDVGELQLALAEGRFKTNSALIVIDFLIRGEREGLHLEISETSSKPRVCLLDYRDNQPTTNVSEQI